METRIIRGELLRALQRYEQGVIWEYSSVFAHHDIGRALRQARILRKYGLLVKRRSLQSPQHEAYRISALGLAIADKTKLLSHSEVEIIVSL